MGWPMDRRNTGRQLLAVNLACQPIDRCQAIAHFSSALLKWELHILYDLLTRAGGISLAVS